MTNNFYFQVQEAINDDDTLPNLSRSTTYKILKHLNFKYATRNRKSCLIDRQDIILWRKKYLLAIQQYRREGKVIYYQFETWVNEGNIPTCLINDSSNYYKFTQK